MFSRDIPIGNCRNKSRYFEGKIFPEKTTVIRKWKYYLKKKQLESLVIVEP